jgi:hypothetical protein
MPTPSLDYQPGVKLSMRRRFFASISVQLPIAIEIAQELWHDS